MDERLEQLGAASSEVNAAVALMAEAGAIRASAAELLERAQQLRLEGSSKTQDAVDAASRAEKAEVAHLHSLLW